jgi:hypothetical protein
MTQSSSGLNISAVLLRTEQSTQTVHALIEDAMEVDDIGCTLRRCRESR